MKSLVTKILFKFIIGVLFIAIIMKGEIPSVFAKKNNHDVQLSKKSDSSKDVDDVDDDEDDEGEDDEEGEDEEGSHNAGRNCLTSGCHSGSGEERFSIGGTIYTDADGTDARVGAKIKVIDTNGSTATLTSNQIGNFYTEKSMTAPFTITASYQGREVEMPTEASGGGCNADGCHAEGSSAGRIFISTNDLDLTGTVTESSSDGGSSEISYNSNIKSILDAKCISCHQSGGAKSDVPLTTYAEVTDTKLVTPGSADSLLIRKLNKDLSEGTMWVNLNSTSEYNKIKDWIVVYNAQEYSSSQGSAGAAISDAKVKLSKNGRVKYKTTTDSTGAFVLEKVKAGKYTLKVFKKGYKRHTQSYQMNQSNSTSLEITLNKK
ncbi:MAG TPA: carboxypeptidase-like regulatory domain-containing protein [Candidatus Wunengus sp. YC63]|uniref:carboxypeptidase-like regulatory domain-containing protein n=1 Tax=unclassified Candidatus Wunengus TaxID=3367695 RepID=UPI004024DAC3